MTVRERAYKGPDVVNFLKHLMRYIPGKLLIIWDGAPSGHAVRDFLTCGAATRIHLECLPGYAPNLNPDEGIWNYLKRVELKNLSCQNIPHLRLEVCREKEPLRHKTDVIQACIGQPGLI